MWDDDQTADIELERRAFSLAERLLTKDRPSRERALSSLRESDSALAERTRRLLADDALLHDEDGLFELEQRVRRWPKLGDFGEPAFEDETHEAASSVPTEPGIRVGAYRLLSVLGRGGMGTVFSAERADGEVERRVAVKVISAARDGSSIRRRFFAERQILASLEHPNIARMYDAGTTAEGRPFLVMELVEGLPIDEFCRYQRWSPERRLDLFRKVAAAVAYAHRRLVIHRDLKPSNILVSRTGEPMLLDFGIAKILDPTGPRSDTTSSGEWALTPPWASPEQLRGDPITTAADVYALGLVLHHLLVGRLPHDPASSAAEVMSRGYEDAAPKRPSDWLCETEGSADDLWRGGERKSTRRFLKGDLDNIVLKALRFDARERYSSVDALLEDLRRFEQGEPVSATRDTWSYKARKFLKRYWAPVAVCLTIMGLLALLALSMSNQARVVALSADQARSEAERARETKDFLAQLLSEADEEARRRKSVDLRSLLDAGEQKVRGGEVQDLQTKVELLEILADGYIRLGHFTTAARLFGEIEGLLQSEGPAVERSRILTKLAAAHMDSGRWEEAMSIHRRLAALGLGDEPWLAHERARAFGLQGQLQRALYERLPALEALSMDIEENRFEISEILHYWSSSLLDLGYLDLHRRLAVQNLSFTLQAEGDMGLAWDQVARSYYQAGQYDRAVYLETRVLSQYRDFHSHEVALALSQIHLAQVLCGAGRYEEAAAKAEDGLQSTLHLLWASPKDRRAEYHLGLVMLVRSQAARGLGFQKEATAHLQDAREVFEPLMDEPQPIIFVRNAYATVLMLQEDFDAARPIVHGLVSDGWRRPDFMALAAKHRLLPDPLPPPPEIPPLPAELERYLRRLPEIPMPWRDGVGTHLIEDAG